MKSSKKMRLDAYLMEKGFFETKSQAQAAVMAGSVKINGEKITKAGFQINTEKPMDIDVQSIPFVSRGGFKLQKALEFFNVDVTDRVCLDAGASTGGFTDCLLQKGAKKVYAVDVGYGQLAWGLRCDERVVVVERTNIKNASEEEIYGQNEEKASLAVMDLSFISITKVLENIKNLLSENCEIVSLIKPQFEAGRECVPKSGVIKDKSVHVNVIKNIIDFACTIGLFPVNLTYSPIKGPAGNIEYLVHLTSEKGDFGEEQINQIVETANEKLA